MALALELGGIKDPDVRRALEQVAIGLGGLAQYFSFGAGAPGFTPPGRAVYLRLDGGAGTTLYVWEGAAWVGK